MEEFVYPFKGSKIQEWKANRILAESAFYIWKEVLGMQFPDRRFNLILLNNFMLVEDENEQLMDWMLMPCIRLWTATDNRRDEYYKLYHVHDILPDSVFDYETEPLSRLFSIEEILERVDQQFGQSNLQEYRRLQDKMQGSCPGSHDLR